jgi:hypothetical protein
MDAVAAFAIFSGRDGRVRENGQLERAGEAFGGRFFRWPRDQSLGVGDMRILFLRSYTPRSAIDR